MIVKYKSHALEARAPYVVQDFSSLHDFKHLPDALIEAHLKLYEGYVRNVDLLHRRLGEVTIGSPEWSEMHRRIGFELNGMRLHELYFENLSPGKSRPARALEKHVSSLWSSFEKWKEDFKVLGGMRGVGWVILYQDPKGGRLSNHWISLHETGHPSGFAPLLVMDVWEHAFTGMDRPAYIDAFFENVDWDRVESRRRDP